MAAASPFLPNLSAQQEQWGQADDEEDNDVDSPRTRRHAPSTNSAPDTSQANNAIAVGSQFAWLGRGDGLWRIDLRDGTRLKLLDPSGSVRAVSVSPDGAFVVVAIGGRVLLSADRGASFHGVGSYARTRVVLAVDSSGLIAFMDSDGVHTRARTTTKQTTTATSISNDTAGIQGLVACPEGILAWSRNALFHLLTGDRSTGMENLGPLPPGGHKIFCGRNGDAFAFGTKLWRKTPDAHAWSPLSFGAGEIRSLAQAGGILWVASQAGVWPVRLSESANPPNDSPRESRNEGPRSTAVVIRRPRLPRFDSSPFPWWHVLLPRVDVEVWAMHRPSDLAFGVLLFATFTLDPRKRASRPLDQLRTTYLQHETQRATYAATSEEEQAVTRIWRDP